MLLSTSCGNEGTRCNVRCPREVEGASSLGQPAHSNILSLSPKLSETSLKLCRTFTKTLLKLCRTFTKTLLKLTEILFYPFLDHPGVPPGRPQRRHKLLSLLPPVTGTAIGCSLISQRIAHLKTNQVGYKLLLECYLWNIQKLV